jgi:hypothetical protein
MEEGATSISSAILPLIATHRVAHLRTNEKETDMHLLEEMLKDSIF